MIIWFFWLQPIADYLTNGVIRKYMISIREVNGTSVNVEGGKSVFSGQIELLTNMSSYWLSVQAATDTGRSPAQYLLVTLPSAGEHDVVIVYSTHQCDVWRRCWVLYTDRLADWTTDSLHWPQTQTSLSLSFAVSIQCWIEMQPTHPPTLSGNWNKYSFA